MNENEVITRKQWLTVLIASGVLNLCYFASQTPGNPAYSQFPEWVSYLILAINGLSLLLFSYIFYRCIYRKPGTKLLMFILITAPIAMFAAILGYISGKVPLPSNTWLWAHTLVSNVLGVWWYILNLKMRRINKKLQKTATI